MADEEDLYGDLGQAPLADAEDSYQSLQKKLKECEAKLAASQAKNQELFAQNQALKKNISCLYKTAKKELERKDILLQQATQPR
eukprot:m.28063 g.28063  ORF g.28063 m.28063 type:complete len:84 (-) comp9009_c0_seq1:623-874(-)